MANLYSETMEFSPEIGVESGQFEWGGEAEWGEAEWVGEAEVFSEAELMELAGELLEVTDEAELDRFLGGLIRKAGRAVGGVIRSPVVKAIGGVLKGVAKRALPIAGGVLGGFVGGPLGAKIGSGLASAAGSALGLEAETMSSEDREFEGAKNFVRMAGDAVKSAASAPTTVNPTAVAQKAIMTAAKKLAPGLLGMGPWPAGKLGRGGRWLRRGRNIIIFDC